MRRFALAPALACAGVCALSPGRAGAYPYLPARPVETVFAGPADASLSALLYNPAALRLLEGFHIEVLAGGQAFLGSYDRSAPLPAGFAPGQPAQPATAGISWFNPGGLIAASWDLGSDSVTLAAGVYTPYIDLTRYAGDDDAAAQQTLSTRYHAVSQTFFSLQGSVGVALRVTSWFYLGGNFNFGWTRDQWLFFRDPAAPGVSGGAADGLTCGGPGPCEQWANRLDTRLQGSSWGYGLSAGVLILPPGLEDRLWLGASFVSPLLTGLGAQVGLSDSPPGAPPCVPESPGQPSGLGGAQLSGPSSPGATSRLTCYGATQINVSFPYLVYLGARVRLPGRSGASGPPARQGRASLPEPTAGPGLWPHHWEIGSWLRISAPDLNHSDLEILLERRAFQPFNAPPHQFLPAGQQPAVAVDVDFRQLWHGFHLAEALLYESPRAGSAAVSPANLEANKLDVSVTARVRISRRGVWLSATTGLTSYLFPGDAGSGFQPGQAAACRAAAYDVTTPACQDVLNGWALPTAAGRYSLFVLHGGAGIEIHL